MAVSEPRLAEADSSFELLYRTHRRDVYNFVLHDVRNPEEAEDVTQVAFLNAYRALRSGRPPEKPRAWLFTIAQNVSRRRFRRRSTQLQEVPLDTELAVSAPDDYDGPTADEITAAFRELPDMQRVALAMREIQGRSYAEIAAELGLSVSAVETLIFRARRALRTELEPERGRLRSLVALPLALPAALAKGFGAAATSIGRTGLLARAAGVVSAIVVGGAVVEFVPPLLAAEDEAAVVVPLATPNYVPRLDASEATSAASPGAAKDDAKGESKRTKRAGAGAGAAAGGGAAKSADGEAAGGGALPQVPEVSAPSVALPEVEVPSVEVPSVEVPSAPAIEAPAVPDLPELPLPPAPPPPSLDTPDLG